MVKDIRPGSDSSGPKQLTAVGNRLIFTANDGVHGDELWSSDGTRDGTILLKDINTANFESGVDDDVPLKVLGYTVFFAGDDGPSHGNELWKTDGTPAGTERVTDLNPGSPDGLPLGSDNNFASLGSTLFFSGDEGEHGFEPWVIREAPCTITGTGPIVGTAASDVICGSPANDTITAKGGRDIVFAGAGDDIVSGGNQPDTLYGEAGNDTLKGGTGKDLLDGGSGTDICKPQDDGATKVNCE